MRGFGLVRLLLLLVTVTNLVSSYIHDPAHGMLYLLFSFLYKS